MDLYKNRAAAPPCDTSGDAAIQPYWGPGEYLPAGSYNGPYYIAFTVIPTETIGPKTLRIYLDSFCDVPESNDNNIILQASR